MKSYIVHWFIHDENPPNSLFFDGVSTYIGVARQASDGFFDSKKVKMMKIQTCGPSVWTLMTWCILKDKGQIHLWHPHHTCIY